MAHQSGYLSFIDPADFVTLRIGLVDFDLEYEVRQLPIPRFGLTFRRNIQDVGQWLFVSKFLLPSGVAPADIKAGATLTLNVKVNAADELVLAGITERFRMRSPIDGAVEIDMTLRGDNLLQYKGGELIPNTL